MAELKLNHRFDIKTNRQYLNDQLTVLHCHHYAILFTQLGLDAKQLVDGTKILQESAEDTFFKVLTSYYKNNNVMDIEDRISIAMQMFSAVGLGKMVKNSLDENGGEIEMPKAYLDEGWILKWGKNNEPVNYIGMGFVAGMVAAVFDKSIRSYKVTETQSRVMGADKSVLKITL